jgi:hypothetical protein
LNTGNIFFTVTGTLAPPSPTPAPSSLILLMTAALAGAGMWFVRRKLRRRSQPYVDKVLGAPIRVSVRHVEPYIPRNSG